MTKPQIGENAGKVWQALEKIGSMPFIELKDQTSLSEQEY
ncbi:MAG: winged helix-turn-helix domain-containing protein [Bacteroidales bacterium]|nr:winged helix-turn-helix domain-containing protein [Bacteroidales bacterium]